MRCSVFATEAEPSTAERRLLSELFPFYLAVDRALTLTGCGPSLEKYLPDLRVGVTLPDQFAVLRPSVDFTFASLLSHVRALFVFRHHSGRRLRGQMRLLANGDLMLLATPVLTSADDLRTSGLGIHDFPVHDTSIDYLMLLSSTRTMLRESQRMRDALAHERQQLAVIREQLEAANVSLRRADTEKDATVACVAHELATPAHSLLSLAELLLATHGDAQHPPAEKLLMIRKTALHLREMLRDLLDVAKVGKGATALSVEPVSLLDVVGMVRQILDDDLRDRSQTLEVCIEPADLCVETDGRRLLQIICNLASNASKYSPDGTRLVITAAQRQSSVAITVDDGASRIREGDRERIFARFVRLGAHSDSGSGIGLYVAQTLTAALGGSIAVTDTCGAEGNRFEVTIPARHSAGWGGDLVNALSRSGEDPSDGGRPAA